MLRYGRSDAQEKQQEGYIFRFICSSGSYRLRETVCYRAVYGESQELFSSSIAFYLLSFSSAFPSFLICLFGYLSTYPRHPVLSISINYLCLLSLLFLYLYLLWRTVESSSLARSFRMLQQQMHLLQQQVQQHLLPQQQLLLQHMHMRI